VTIVWSLPVRGERLTSSRGDLVRARSLIQALRADGHQVTVVEDAEHAHTKAVVATYRSWLRSLLPPRPALILRDLGRAIHGCVHGIHIATAARALRADLIIETQVAYSASAALAGQLAGIPFVLDDCSPTCEEDAVGTGFPALARTALRLQAGSARAVVAVSPALAGMLVDEGVPHRKIACVPNGINTDAFARAIAARQRESAEAGRCVIVFVGSFQPWHRVDLLFQAAAELADIQPIQIVLAGDGPGLTTALDSAAACRLTDRVTALGAIAPDAIPALLARCDIGVLPHSNEYGDPMKLREYAAAGLAVVAPNLEPVREVVVDGETGLLFPPGDADALARTLARLAGDPAERHRIGEEARRRAFATGSWSGRARALLASAGWPCAAAPSTISVHATDGHARAATGGA
jgi:glycosyltransferase involved in cell wall biosynthesis